MSKLERITLTMPAEMAAKLRAAVEQGSYATSSEMLAGETVLGELEGYAAQRVKGQDADQAA